MKKEKKRGGQTEDKIGCVYSYEEQLGNVSNRKQGTDILQKKKRKIITKKGASIFKGDARR